MQARGPCVSTWDLQVELRKINPLVKMWSLPIREDTADLDVCMDWECKAAPRSPFIRPIREPISFIEPIRDGNIDLERCVVWGCKAASFSPRCLSRKGGEIVVRMKQAPNVELWCCERQGELLK